MKKYTVTNYFENKEQYEGSAPHNGYREDFVLQDIEANSPEEAIEIAIDYLTEQFIGGIDYAPFNPNVDKTEDDIFVRNENGEVITHYYGFEAKEVGADDDDE